MTAARPSRSGTLASALLLALVMLCLAWELWLAPLRPGGSWLALKVLPLLWIAPGIVRGRLYTFAASTNEVRWPKVEGLFHQVISSFTLRI